MTPLQKELIHHVIQLEGGYVDDPNDSGGETKYGITQEVAEANGYDGDMTDLPIEVAEKIYAQRYWAPIQGDYLASLSEPVLREVFDTAVNMGVPRASIMLQMCLNAFNNRGVTYKDLVLDGIIGGKTLSALAAHIAHRGSKVLVRSLNCLQGATYIRLALEREKDETFVYGWMKNRVVI